jgi:hypothetical protein
VRFWDTSALVPLLTQEDATAEMTTLFATDRNLVVAFITPVEIASALTRKAGVNDDLRRLAVLEANWTIVDEYEPATRIARVSPPSIVSAPAMQCNSPAPRSRQRNAMSCLSSCAIRISRPPPAPRATGLPHPPLPNFARSLVRHVSPSLRTSHATRFGRIYNHDRFRIPRRRERQLGETAPRTARTSPSAASCSAPGNASSVPRWGFVVEARLVHGVRQERLLAHQTRRSVVQSEKITIKTLT